MTQEFLAAKKISTINDDSQAVPGMDEDLLEELEKAIKALNDEAAEEDANVTEVYLNRIATPLGLMLAGTTGEALCLLEFMDRSGLEAQLNQLCDRLNCSFRPGSNKVTDEAADQLSRYFDGELKSFTVPLIHPGTDFQQSVWEQLQTIPYGHTRSYQKQAEQIGNKKAVRAVARANGKNRIAVVIPCHRVVGKNGKLTGYSGGLQRKKYLLNLEQANV